MLVTFLLSLFALVTGYLAIAAALVAARGFKIMALHEEHLIVRSREHKTHTKAHAQQLLAAASNDLIWPRALFSKALAARAWLKS